MDRAVYSEWAILRFFRKAKLGRISVARKQQGQSLALWRALVTDHPSFLPPHRGRRVRTYGRVAGGGPLGARADDAALAPAPACSSPVR